ncbi:MAG: HsdM family class I SAM-dependent methyltransferase [Ginsengibacter sp.]
MLTANLKEIINQKWQNCWPASELRPMAIIDLISFLFFFKRGYESKLLPRQLNDPVADNFIFSPDIVNFSWSQLQSVEAKEIHKFFTKKNGLFHLAAEYAKTDAPLSDYFKTPLLIEPTPKLLSIGIEIVNIIESSEQPAKEDIFRLLLSKCDEDSLIPDAILDLIIEIAKPVHGDVIFDPCVGSGNLLLKVMQRVQYARHSGKVVTTGGCEHNGVYLRIAAMNMAIHGIDDHLIHAYSSNDILHKKPSLILSALRTSDITESSGETSQTDPNIMDDIIESLSPVGFAVVFVEKEYLQSDLPAHSMTRKKLVDQNFLEAVISIDSKNNSPFAGGSILLFSKNKNNASNVWFYKLHHHKKNETGEQRDIELSNLQDDEVMQIVKRWRLRGHSNAVSPANSFCIDISFLKANHYNLNFNHYKIVNQFPSTTLKARKPITPLKETVVVTQKDNPGQFFKSSSPLRVKKRKRKMAPVVLVVLFLLCTSIGLYWFFSKNNKNVFFGKTLQPKTNVSPANKAAVSNPEILSANPSPDVKKEQTIQPIKTHTISK